MTDTRCCFNYINLNKGIMFIGILTLLEFCIAFSNFSIAWFLMFIKLYLICLFIACFKWFEVAKVRKVLLYSYAACEVVEIIAILVWVIRWSGSGKAEVSCTKLSAYERSKQFMSDNTMRKQEFIDNCVSEQRASFYLFVFFLLAISIPLRVLFTFTMVKWHKVAADEEERTD